MLGVSILPGWQAEGFFRRKGDRVLDAALARGPALAGLDELNS